jgi:hypothetical protein
MRSFLHQHKPMARRCISPVATFATAMTLSFATSGALYAGSTDHQHVVYIGDDTNPEAVVTEIKEVMAAATADANGTDHRQSGLVPVYRRGSHCMYIETDAFKARITDPSSMKEAAIGFIDAARKPETAEAFVVPILANLQDLPEKIMDRGTAFRQLIKVIDECGATSKMVNTN